MSSTSGTGSSTITQLFFHVGEKSYEIRPAPLRMLKKIWAALPKMTALSAQMQTMIEEAGGAAKVRDDMFMDIHSKRIDVLVGVLCEAAGITVSEAEENLTKDQVEELQVIFNQYLGMSGFDRDVEDSRPNGGAGPPVVGPVQALTETGTPSRPN